MMTRSATTALLIAAGLLAVLAPAVLAENQQTLDFPITTLRADSTRVGVRAARSQQEQSGNPQYITAHPDKGLVVSLGAPSLTFITDRLIPSLFLYGIIVPAGKTIPVSGIV